MMKKSFSDVGLSLNIDGSEDHKMNFQDQKPGKPDSFDYCSNNEAHLWKYYLKFVITFVGKRVAAISKCRYI